MQRDDSNSAKDPGIGTARFRRARCCSGRVPRKGPGNHRLVCRSRRGGDGLSAGLLRLTSQPFGLRVTATELQRQSWLPQDIEGLAAVCVVLGRGVNERAGRANRRRSSTHGRIAIAEVTTRQGIRQAIQSGFSALIVAGNEAGGASRLRVVVRPSASSSGGRHSTGLGKRGHWACGRGWCVAAGAAGVVLDGALLLARESPLRWTVPAGRSRSGAGRAARPQVCDGRRNRAGDRAGDG